VKEEFEGDSPDFELLHISSAYSRSRQSQGDYHHLLDTFSLNKPHLPDFITTGQHSKTPCTFLLIGVMIAHRLS